MTKRNTVDRSGRKFSFWRLFFPSPAWRDGLGRSCSAPATTKTAETKRQSGQMPWQLQRLRAHGLIRRIPKSHRYKITDQGRLLTTATTLVHDTSIKSLALAV
jgi:hypothetical protein